MTMTKVLLVDDNQKVRELCERVLMTQGYAVMTVKNATGALELEDFTPDLLITDFGLPDETGLVVSKTLAARFPGLKVLMISGHPLDEIVEEDLPHTHAYLEKPFTVPELLTAVSALLERPAPDSTNAAEQTPNPKPAKDARHEDDWKRISGK